MTISAFRSFYSLPIDAYPHGMKSAMKWARWPPYLAQKSPGSAREDKELWQRWNSTRGVEGLGSELRGSRLLRRRPQRGLQR